MKHAIKLAVVGVLALVMVLPAVTLAHDGEDHATLSETREHEATTLREQAKNRLSEAQKKTCETRAANITALMTRSVTRAENYGKLLASITERVETYANKQPVTLDKDRKPTNKYYLDKIDLAQAQFNEDFSAFQSAAVFSCDSDNPKSQITAFQAAHRTVMKDLKQWRVEVRDIISMLKASARGNDAPLY